METLLVPPRRLPWIAILLAAGYLIAGCAVLGSYPDWRSANGITGMVALPLTLLPVRVRKPRPHMALLSVVLLLLSLLAPVKAILFFAWCSLLLFLYESSGRQARLPTLLTLFFMSPVCQYFAHIFSFPIRLQLTEAAGSLLRLADQKVSIAGNMILCHGSEFSVDPACMGLHMVITSSLCGLILLAVQQRRSGLYLPGYWIFAVLLVLLLLNVVANLLRILLLVYFRILPGDPLHDICGLLCLLVYVLLPAFFLVRKLVVRAGKPFPVTDHVPDPYPLAAHSAHWLLLPLFLFALHYSRQQGEAMPGGVLPKLEGYAVSWYDKEVIKIAGEHALVYVKPARGVVYTDHNPLVCWTGCGYSFRNIQEQQWNSIPVFTGILEKGNERLYTAWWYDNGQRSTLSQWTWRWDMLRGKPVYSIFNVTAGSPQALHDEVARIYALRRQILGRE
ncbi:exosortase N [Taibaiella koreensis]|uniref:exosortase N n=1 Tax=Taibaiella koreensis TaxID=1268548 RepID=UPI000E59A352|nr:exosortase N [Taibaiella koreensis]